MTSIFTTLGAWIGKIFSTPIPFEIFRTVKVDSGP